MEEEIDLRPYILLLLRSWWKIALVSLVAALAVWLISAWIPDQYEATSSVAIVRSRTDINLDPRIVDVAESDILRTDTASRRQALIALVSNNDVALSVLEELGDTLPLENRSVETLLQMVEATNEGDLININVRSTEPEIAAAVANSWAQNYQNVVNNLYGTTNDLSIDGLDAQVQSASATYEEAQEQVEIFISTNLIANLEGEIATHQQLLDAYRTALVRAQVDPITLQSETNHEILSGYYLTLQNIELWLDDARALQDLLEAGSGSTGANLGNILALIGLQNQIFGREAKIDLQVDASTEMLGPIQLRDVEAIINILEKRQEGLLEQIEVVAAVQIEEVPQGINLSDEHPLKVSINGLEQTIQTLKSDLESQKAQQRELLQNRDQAWETYQTLTSRMVEEEIATQTVGTEVRLAARAVPPDRPVNSSTVLTMAAASGISAALVIMIIFMNEWWQQSLGRVEETQQEID